MRTPEWKGHFVFRGSVAGHRGCHREPDERGAATGAMKTASEATGATKGDSWPGFAEFRGPILIGHTLKPTDLTPTEFRFGVAPKRGPEVTYQDGIILMENGDKAIRSFASDGLSWTLDASAPQVSDIQVGKILFATSRCVGRVLAMNQAGNAIRVVLGPVQLTDLIKKGNFSYDAPLDLNSLIAYAAPDYPAGTDANDAVAAAAARSASTGVGSGAAPRRRLTSHASDATTPPATRTRHAEYFVVSPAGEWTPMPTVYRPNSRIDTYSDFQTKPANFRRVVQQVTPGIPALPNPGAFGTVPAPDSSGELPNVNFGGFSATPCAINCGGIGVRLHAHHGGARRPHRSAIQDQH